MSFGEEYKESLFLHLSKNFRESEAISFLISKLEKEPYSFIGNIKYKDYPYDEFVQGIYYDYYVDEKNNRDVTVKLKFDDFMKKTFVRFEIRHGGNEVNIITKSPREDTSIFHLRHNGDRTIEYLNKKIKYHNTDKEQLVGSSYCLFSSDGAVLKYYDSNSIKSNKKTY